MPPNSELAIGLSGEIPNINNEKLKDEIKENLKKSDGVAIKDIGESNAFVEIRNFYDARKDSKEHQPYTVKYELEKEIKKDSNGKELGGHEFIKKTENHSSTAELLTGISAYGTDKLEPLGYFSIYTYDSALLPIDKALPEDKEYKTELINQSFSKIKDSIFTQYKPIKVFIPKNADSSITNLLIEGNYEGARQKCKEIINPCDLDAIENDIRNTDKYKEKKDEMEAVLSNYYLYLLALECDNLQKKNIYSLYNGYLKLMTLTKNDGLLKGCSNSLARLEEKSRRLNIDLTRAN